MEAKAVKHFFDCLYDALSIEDPGTFIFSEALEAELAKIVPEPMSDVSQHDISNLVHRLKENALGRPDLIDGEVRNTPALFIPFACELLAKRWYEIKDTPQDYTYCSVKQNEPYLTFVKKLVNFSVSCLTKRPDLNVSIKRWMKMFCYDDKLVSNIYALLIPTLTQALDFVTQGCLIDTDLHNYVLSENEKSLFSLKNSQDSFDKGTGFFNVDVAPVRFFTSLEKERIKQKPWRLRPLCVNSTYVDFIITKSHPAPLPGRSIINDIHHLLSRAKIINTDPEFSFEGLRTKYSVNNETLSSLHIYYLWELYVAKHYDAYKAQCESKGLRASQKGAEDYLESKFNATLDTSGRAQNEVTLGYLSTKSCQAQMTIIVSDMLKYCDALKTQQPEQYQRLMNLVLCEGKTRPTTFFSLLESLRFGENCSTAALLSEFSCIFDEVQRRMVEISQPERQLMQKSEAVPVPSARNFGIFSYFYPSSSSNQKESPSEQHEDPNSVVNKLAYSPEGSHGLI